MTNRLFPKQAGNQGQLAGIVLASFAAFTTYFCMYGFRKSISAGTFEGLTAFGISFKSAIVIAQVLGYMTSKFIGIRFISEINPAKRGFYILSLIGGAHFCLLLMGLIPLPYNVFFLFLNGMCLGLIWGLVFSFIEGRKYTDLIALILSINFIFSSGVVKTVGRISIESWKVDELYMPFVTGCLFLPLLFLAVYLLKKIPAPGVEEKLERGERTQLNKEQRRELFNLFRPGLIAVILINLLLTILRDIKDNYAVEMLQVLDPGAPPGIFAQMETIASIAVFFLLLTLTGIHNHFKSLYRQHLVIGLGFITILLCAFGIMYQLGSPIFWLVSFTIGLYLSYNALQCLFLERFIAAFKIRGNIGFFFYLMDSVGYLGSCFLILHKELFSADTNWLPYFIRISWFFGISGAILVAYSWYYFGKKYKSQPVLTL
ncbi:DUF5690 family protein [Flavihumibacter sp. UBA7668]|uniref:DUF5690 family protein n=1 Tax=Flavihumibacter sp. UBA7668 TaxID=1946542 RepID=UPI0025BE009F|nr:DUF5690 family protein [Flavihumibacter sp. UBA7668]